MSGATSIQGSTESIILSVHAASIILSLLPAESMILSPPPAESIIHSVHAESIILSAGGTKEQSIKSCSGNCGNNGGGRGDSGGGDRFDVGSGGDDCSDDSNNNGNIDGDSGDGDSGNDDCAVACSQRAALRVLYSQQATLRVSYSQHRL